MADYGISLSSGINTLIGDSEVPLSCIGVGTSNTVSTQRVPPTKFTMTIPNLSGSAQPIADFKAFCGFTAPSTNKDTDFIYVEGRITAITSQSIKLEIRTSCTPSSLSYKVVVVVIGKVSTYSRSLSSGYGMEILNNEGKTIFNSKLQALFHPELVSLSKVNYRTSSSSVPASVYNMSSICTISSFAGLQASNGGSGVIVANYFGLGFSTSKKRIKGVYVLNSAVGVAPGHVTGSSDPYLYGNLAEFTKLICVDYAKFS